MSELIQKHDNRATIRWKLLTGASALVLIAAVPNASAGDADHPLVWIELGGTFDSISGTGDPFVPPFTQTTPTPPVFAGESPIAVQKPERFTSGGEGSITLQPDDSDWVFSAGVRYGRSNNKRDINHQSPVVNKMYDVLYKYHTIFTSPPFQQHYITKTSENYAQTTVKQSEKHLIVDFQAGKDVGLGMFGRGGSSVVSAGVRVARFEFNSNVTIRARPNVELATRYFEGLVPYPDFRWNAYYQHGVANRSFNGIGPSLSWKASAPFAGNSHDGELSLDFGLNGALLFGRQKAKIHHHTSARHYGGYDYEVPVPGYPSQTTHYTVPASYPPRTSNQIRSRNVTVPNLGANIGISYRIEDAKLSLGYRTDNFFGAMDTGIDAAKKTTLGFNGLYASISIGLGD